MTDEFRVQGLPISELAEEFGTPLYVYDGDKLSAQFTNLRTRLHPRMDVFYSLKANPAVAVCGLFRSLGAGAEVSSRLELMTALRAGVPPEDIGFLGPGKSVLELRECIAEGILAIVAESLSELALIDSLARDAGTTVRVMLRVNPSFTVKGPGLAMGGKPRQFGIDEEQVLSGLEQAARLPNLAIIGVHVYVGTRILDAKVIGENTRRILGLAERVSRTLAFPLEVVDVGGGWGIAYFEGETDLDVAEVTGRINPLIEDFTARNPGTRLITELGRYLAAPAGIYVARVRHVKTSMGERFAITDGGMHHHMAAVGIGSFVRRNFPIVSLTRVTEPASQTWHVTGPLCTPQDTLGKGVALPPVCPGDLIGVLRAGAYGPTASPVNFLGHGGPAEVLVESGRAVLIRDRDDVTELLNRQHSPVFN